MFLVMDLLLRNVMTYRKKALLSILLSAVSALISSCGTQDDEEIKRNENAGLYGVWKATGSSFDSQNIQAIKINNSEIYFCQNQINNGSGYFHLYHSTAQIQNNRIHADDINGKQKVFNYDSWQGGIVDGENTIYVRAKFGKDLDQINTSCNNFKQS